MTCRAALRHRHAEDIRREWAALRPGRESGWWERRSGPGGHQRRTMSSTGTRLRGAARRRDAAARGRSRAWTRRVEGERIVELWGHATGHDLRGVERVAGSRATRMRGSRARSHTSTPPVARPGRSPRGAAASMAALEGRPRRRQSRRVSPRSGLGAATSSARRALFRDRGARAVEAAVGGALDR